jgi:hypothetical protein
VPRGFTTAVAAFGLNLADDIDNTFISVTAED